jgi:predicted permease
MPWEYQELLNQNLQILFVLGLGALSARLQLFNQGPELRTFNKIVFAILLPASILLGLGLRTNLRDGAIWRFIGGFLMLRAICLLGVTVVFWKRGVAAITANWLFVSWVSTVVLGVPLVRAALGPQYSNLGVVAGISSFIFQLPAMLILFEIAKGRQDEKKSNNSSPSTSIENLPNQEDRRRLENNNMENHDTASAISATPSITANTTTASTIPVVLTKEQARSIGNQLLRNPILWAILIGIVVSITTLGPRYLNPGSPPAEPNCDYAQGAGFIFLILFSLASCTNPIAIFATGIFLSHKSPIRCGWRVAIGYMIVKLIFVPAVMVGCAAAVGLENGPARAAVLLASLPISAAAFTLCDRYSTCLHQAVANIFWGTVLVLPTTLAWMAFMDAVDLFPMVKTPVNNVCTGSPNSG